MVERDHPPLPLTRQAELLDIARSSLYYTPVPMSQAEVDLTNLVDKIYTAYPFYGNRRIKTELEKNHQRIVSRTHVRKLTTILGLETIYPRPKDHSSDPNDQHKKYPYLLNGLKIDHPNQVWGTDITYIKLNQGFCYLVALMDWFSRYVVAWELSATLEIDFVLSNLRQAVKVAVPELHNSDQGSHFTSPQYTGILDEHGIRISMDGRGRCMDNIFTERLWRTVKYENVYLKSYADMHEARAGLTEYFDFYNHRRFHTSLNKLTPTDVYFNHNK